MCSQEQLISAEVLWDTSGQPGHYRIALSMGKPVVTKKSSESFERMYLYMRKCCKGNI